ncbi:Scr1 family TA system antitoxin-like transcriptional regulator [Streptomyces sp. NPDC058301]|uniref:Scr1 family TA system antitoxin-like transcriptional regulator n=1 Tax=Streptomyces sp. NPDC058301 TaxID=3346436 RepID=UPI0036E9C359
MAKPVTKNEPLCPGAWHRDRTGRRGPLVPEHAAGQGICAHADLGHPADRGVHHYDVVLGEQALYTNIGGPEVMRPQIERLLLGILPATARRVQRLRLLRKAHSFWANAPLQG